MKKKDFINHKFYTNCIIFSYWT